nr:beta-galactosidase 13-like [Tanacetum cinerariifolium]
TSSSFVTTCFDESPLEEFGLIRDPKWSQTKFDNDGDKHRDTVECVC